MIYTYPQCCVQLPRRPHADSTYFVQVQEAMMQNMWSNDVLALPHCHAQQGTGGRLVFYGPRIQCGIYEGEPT